MSKENEIDHWFVQYHQTIYKYILLMVRDAQEAEDLTQDTFVRAYQHHHSFKRDASPKTWLFKIAHNTTIDYLRKKKPLRVFANVFLNKEQDVSTEDIILIKENAQELYYALNKLKASYKQVIILRKIKGFSIMETAHILDWSESKVKSTLLRALQALSKEWMDEEGNDGEKRAKK